MEFPEGSNMKAPRGFKMPLEPFYLFLLKNGIQ